MEKNYCVADINLAEQGEKQIEFAREQMIGLSELKKQLLPKMPFKNIRISMALHVTKETAVLIETLTQLGAKVVITGCNPLSTQDDVAAALAQNKINVFAKKGVSTQEYYEQINQVLDFEPHITIDDGCDLVNLIHTKRNNLLKNIIGGCEETTTGIIRLKAMKNQGVLKYPIVAVNDSATKHLVDNYYGTGQSTIDGILRATNILIAGKKIVVCGYGDCGKGVAMRAKSMGAKVIIVEVNYFRALQAYFDGYDVMPINDASKIGDIFITATGDKSVIRLEHMKQMKSGAILCNSGHFDCEIQIQKLKQISKITKIREFMDKYEFEKKHIYILADGRLVNLSAAEGHPSFVMSFSFCNQVLAAKFLIENKDKLKNDIYTLSNKTDEKISKLHLDALGIKIDKLTDEQKEYLSNWREGT
ncbi:MAG: adenosylhomocysteinase [Candidatus Aenigmarchaeota archaeon ex4484_52]|nr:MAG: adenosylhomocysteinase [Candidatus Aenigmarchaeota archaeon ex4484_52]